MKKSGFLYFLIVSLAMTAFLTGYIMVKRGADNSSGSKTGTILDKFSGKQPATDSQEIKDPGGPLQLTERRVLSVVNSYNNGSVLYFEENTGKLFELNLETGAEQPVLDKTLLNFVSAVWSPTRKAFIGSFVSGAETILKYFNINTGQETPLDPGIRSVAFSPDGNLLAYHYLVPADNQVSSDTSTEPNSAEDPSEANQTGKIMISEPDGKYPKKILNTRLNGIELGWPTKEKISLQTSTSELFLLSEDGKLSSLLGPNLGLNKKWSPSGKKLIFSFTSGNLDQDNQIGDILKIKIIESGEESQLIEASASKCVWSIDDISIYCAIPKSPSVDEIYKINTLDGSHRVVAEPLTGIREILLSPLEEQVLFVGSSDEKIYSIKLAD